MIRGTTPTLTFNIPFQTNLITDLSIAFVQLGELALEKTLSDCTLEEKSIHCRLSENDTLSFKSIPPGAYYYDILKDYDVKIQLRVACGEDKLASNIISVSVKDILRDGPLNG